MATKITKTWTLDAAHQLPHHQGKCQNLHGHTYKVEVECVGEVHPTDGTSSEGMVIDFGVVSAFYKELVHSRLDHQYLNDVVPLEYHPTTAENLARYIFDTLTDELGDLVVAVVVWETPTGNARYARDPAHL